MSAFPFSLFTRLMHSSPFRPATNVWRAVELDVMIERALPRIKEARNILDLGCGNGRMLGILRPSLPPHAKIIGIDIDPLETSLAEGTGLFDQVICGSAETLPFETASFDAVIANSVLEHVGPIRKVIDEVGRILKPGGLFIVTVPGPNFHACLCSDKDEVCRAYFEQLDNRLIHLRYWTLAEWLERLSPAQMSLIDSHEYLNKAEATRWRKLGELTGGLVFRFTGKRRGPLFMQKVYRADGKETAPPWWVVLLSRLVLLGFKEPEKPDLFGCLMFVARRDPDAYTRKEEK